MTTPLLTRRAVLLAAVESTYNSAESTSASTDAVLVSEPDFSADVQTLERNFSRASLSKLPMAAGRKLATMTFQTEIRSNGLVDSGSLAQTPMLARLMRACGYSLTAFSAADVGTVHNVGDHENAATWADGGTLTNTAPIPYKLEVTTGGASGTAEITVTSPVTGEGNAAAAVSSGSAFTVGDAGLELTPTFSGDLVVGQTWFVLLKPKGIEAVPVSSGFESMTLRMYLDGILHVMTGSIGTFAISADAGQLGSISWTFTGQYVTPVDGALPTGVAYETTLPAQFELAQMSIDGYTAVINSLSMTQNNDIQPRSDANAADGYNGVRLVDRNPEMGIDPEAALAANQDFWGKLATAKRMPLSARFGRTVGNTVYLTAPSVQYTGLTYADRSGIRTHDAGLSLPGIVGDDEVSFFFA
jgi:hypothetical protein